MPEAISVKGVVKSFGTGTRALNGLNLAIPEGTVHALLGPNGAGKTTLVRILSTLLRPDAGQVTVLGLDVATQPQLVRGRIGLAGQYAALDENLTGYENLVMVGRLYHMPKRLAGVRAAELLEQFSLTAHAGRTVKTYSGGMRRRLDLAGSLIAAPPVLFLDEPTTGLDPVNRVKLWDTIAKLAEGGTTVLLTTQYLEEADRLADKITLIDHGLVIGDGTGEELKRQVGGDRIEVTLRDRDRIPAAVKVLERFSIGELRANVRSGQLTVPVDGGTGPLVLAINELTAERIELVDAGLRRPTLDDVFFALTGHASKAAEEADQADQATEQAAEMGQR